MRREEAELERAGIMNEGWLPDRRGIAMNHFFTLMQVRTATVSLREISCGWLQICERLKIT